MRRPVAAWATAATAALLLVLPAAPVSAAETELRTPGDPRISEPTPIEVGVERDPPAEPVDAVEARLFGADGEEAHGEAVSLACEGECGRRVQQLTYVLPDDGRFDPSTGAPFGAEAPLANGHYVLEIKVVNEAWVPSQTYAYDLHLAVAPSAVTDLEARVGAAGGDGSGADGAGEPESDGDGGAGDDAAEGGGGDGEGADETGEADDGDGSVSASSTASGDGAGARRVALSWTPAPEPDIEAYRVERHDGDAWREAATTGADAEGATDRPGGGEHRYRVVTVRSDGDGGTIETASEEATVEVPSAEGDDGGENGSSDGGGDGNGDGQSGDGDGDGEGGDGEVATSPEVDGGGDGGGSSGVARAPQTGDGQSGSIPGVAGRGGDGEGGDGEGGDGEGFEEELDYGSADRDEEPGQVSVATGGWRGAAGRILDPERIAVPVAAGLLMTATGMHLWRWLRVPI